MNEIEALLEKPVFQALGWTLFHFLWQGALVGLGMLAANVALKKRAAETRYAAACVALVLLLAAPAVTFWLLVSSAPESSARVAVAVDFVSRQEQNRNGGEALEAAAAIGADLGDIDSAEPHFALGALIS